MKPVATSGQQHAAISNHYAFNSPLSLFVLDVRGSIVFISREAQLITGYTIDEVLEKVFFLFIKKEERQPAKNVIEILRTGARITDFKIHFILKSGKLLELTLSGAWNKADGYIHLNQHQYSVDPFNSLQLAFEKKIKDCNRSLSDVLERITEGFIALDENARIIYWNQEAERITGKRREEVLTRNIWECYPEAVGSIFHIYYQRVVKEQKSFQYEAFIPAEERWLEIAAYPSSQGMTGFLRDITQRKRMEEDLENQKRQTRKRITAAVIRAQEKERAQVSLELHDNVNQVLTTVKLYTELCMGDKDSCQPLLQKSSTLIQSCIDEIRSLSKQLSAPSLGKIPLNDSIIELVETITATKKLRIIPDIEKIASLEVSEEMHLGVYRILQEQFTNILKHSEATEVRVAVNLLDDELIIKISDNGRGFDTNEKTQGIGISNMISRAEGLGGRLSINSAPGLGCVLIAHLPLN